MYHSATTTDSTTDLFAPSPAPRWAAGILLTLVAAVIAAWLMGWLDPLVNRAMPALTEATGTVILNGKPMTKGIVQTYCDIPGRMGGLAEIESNGHFRLTTNGDPGIYAGQHKVIVSYMTTSFPPKSLLPEQYTNPKLTPFSIVAKRGVANQIELVVSAPDLVEAESPKVDPAAEKTDGPPQ